jgi:hypothetical protein
MTPLPWAGADPNINKLAIVGLLIVATVALVSLPKPKRTCISLYSFMAVFFYEVLQSFAGGLKDARRTIRKKLKQKSTSNTERA